MYSRDIFINPPTPVLNYDIYFVWGKINDLKCIFMECHKTDIFIQSLFKPLLSISQYPSSIDDDLILELKISFLLDITVKPIFINTTKPAGTVFYLHISTEYSNYSVTALQIQPEHPSERHPSLS